MVEHGICADALKEAEKIEREALLSTSLSHPSVITTFKVCTMLASTAQALRSASRADTDWSAPNMPRTPGSPQQPGSASEDFASGHRIYVDSASTLHGGSGVDYGPGSTQVTPRDSAMSGRGGMRMLQSPFSGAFAGGLSGAQRDSMSSGHDRSSMSGTSPGGNAGAVTSTAAQPAFDSAASNAGRRPAVGRGEEGDYALSPEELAAEDDPDAVEERCAPSELTACLRWINFGRLVQLFKPREPCMHC